MSVHCKSGWMDGWMSKPADGRADDAGEEPQIKVTAASG